MPAILLPEGKQSYQNALGLPLVGGKLYTYLAGTSTPATTWADPAKTVPNANPVILDTRGEATIFWDGNYKIVLKDASDVTIWTVDNATTVIDTGAFSPTQLTDLFNAMQAQGLFDGFMGV
ncbi:hypothetical protein [Sphingobium chungbukense]|uniref:Uncharacterized protein n=1 Tax=Sphingobium chungbukense TaxID=56193 RepID=A0A0M3AR81_9SPHN|nr:hypothetical protein [Sphingobium chungbukense]KKW92697.1 hypothetical protein YP76_07125 [Sphingobium chungbukense]